MTYLDVDTSDTDWSEFKRQGDSERCPLTGVPTAPDYGAAWLYGDQSVDSHAESEGASKSTLKEMFNKFLYRK